MSRIEKTARVWIASTFDAEVAAIEAQNPERAARLREAHAKLQSFVNSLPANRG